MLRLHPLRPPPDPPAERRRPISQERVKWARSFDRILLEHRAVEGTRVYAERHQARWQARAMISLMVELRLHDRSELREHTYRRRGGWAWAIERVDRRPAA
jgi:hypothetical protein